MIFRKFRDFPNFSGFYSFGRHLDVAPEAHHRRAGGGMGWTSRQRRPGASRGRPRCRRHALGTPKVFQNKIEKTFFQLKIMIFREFQDFPGFGSLGCRAGSGGPRRLPEAPGGREHLAKSSEGAHEPKNPLISNGNHPWGPHKHFPALRSR